jgi:pyruvate/2-oxoglutarate dehydrogenase complex dihydrolipoamide acyltransferase (E2) component
VKQVVGQAGRAAGRLAEAADQEPKATKAARRKAQELGVDLSQVQGSGAGKRITVKDVIGAASR